MRTLFVILSAAVLLASAIAASAAPIQDVGSFALGRGLYSGAVSSPISSTTTSPTIQQAIYQQAPTITQPLLGVPSQPLPTVSLTNAPLTEQSTYQQNQPIIQAAIQQQLPMQVLTNPNPNPAPLQTQAFAFAAPAPAPAALYAAPLQAPLQVQLPLMSQQGSTGLYGSVGGGAQRAIVQQPIYQQAPTITQPLLGVPSQPSQPISITNAPIMQQSTYQQNQPIMQQAVQQQLPLMTLPGAVPAPAPAPMALPVQLPLSSRFAGVSSAPSSFSFSAPPVVQAPLHQQLPAMTFGAFGAAAAPTAFNPITTTLTQNPIF